MINSSSPWRKLMLGFFFILGFQIAAHAAVIDEITTDFKPVSGYVVMAEGDEYVIDIDDTSGISTGDIFSVIKPGKKIVHPVTQKVLGTLEEVKGLLKVTRIKSGFSFARPVGKSRQTKRGDSIRRYGNLPAIFWDYTGKNQSLFLQLQKALPDLKWQDYRKAQGSRPRQPAANSETRKSLTFIITESTIEVRDPDFLVIRSYDYPVSLSKSGTAPSKTAAAAVTSAAAIAATPPKPAASVKTSVPVNKETTGEKKFFPVFSEVQNIANLPDVSLITDFIKHGDQLLMASTDGSQIEVYSVANDLKPIAQGSPSYPVKILSLKWWSPDKGHILYLATNTWSDRDQKVRGSLFLLDGNTLKTMIQNIPRILGTFDLNYDGWPETLLGQKFVGEFFFGRRLDELELNGNKISYLKSSLQFPRHFPVLGSVFADVTGDGQLEIVYIRNRILYVYSGKKRLYKSPKQMGGSLSFLTYDIDPTFKDSPNTSVGFEISPVVTDLDGDGHPEILAVASDKGIFGSLAISPDVKKSWLAVFRYQDGRFESGTLGGEFDKPLQGLTVAQQRVLIVATEPGNLMGEGANSHLLAYSLSR